MADSIIRANNNELLINESHTNKYLFYLHRIPTSFLVSKFADFCITEDCKPEGYEEEIFRESNNDLRNFILYVQTVDVPDLSLGVEKIGTQFVDIPHVSGKLTFGDIQTNIMNDENWFVYRMLTFWCYAAHNPEEYNKWKEKEYYNNFYTNATLIILDNHYEKVQEFEFTDVHPSSVGQVNLKQSGPEKIVLPVTWVHTGFVPSDRFVIKRV